MIQNILQEQIIERTLYTKQIQAFWNSKLIKVITGMRRA
jgi:hypothetical protein